MEDALITVNSSGGQFVTNTGAKRVVLREVSEDNQRLYSEDMMSSNYRIIGISIVIGLLIFMVFYAIDLAGLGFWLVFVITTFLAVGVGADFLRSRYIRGKRD